MSHPAVVTRSSFRATRRRESMPGHSWKDACPPINDGFRQEHSHPGGGLPSYPHPRLMPDFWQFPTVSMGLGPMNAIFQARFSHYLHDRGMKDTSQQHVWAFLGDGEMDEPESRGLIQVAANEGPGQPDLRHQLQPAAARRPGARNGKIIQELESFFRGAGWNVINGRVGRRVGRLAAPTRTERW